MSRRVIHVLRIVAMAVVLSLGPAPVAAQEDADNPGGLTGNYLLDARPLRLVYLSLTQGGGTVAGYAVLVEPGSGDSGDGELTSRELPVEGTTDGTAVTLVVGDWLNGTFTMTGATQGSNLVLTYPTDAGGIETAVFVPAGPDAFNEALTSWQSALVTEAALWWMLPMEEDAPPGLIWLSEDRMTADEVAVMYSGIDPSRLAEWGWQASAYRIFGRPEGLDPSYSISFAAVFLHQFGSSDAAGEALAAFADSHDAREWDLVQIDPSGDQVRILTASIVPDESAIVPDDSSQGWVDVIIFVRTGSTVIAVQGQAAQGDPSAETLDLARKLFDPAYLTAARDLAGQFAAMDGATGRIDVLTDGANAELADIHSAIGDMQEILEQARQLATARPMGCVAIVNVEVSLTNLEIAGFKLEPAQTAFLATMEELDAELTTAQQAGAAAQETLITVDAILEAMPSPLTATADVVFSDEQAAIAPLVGAVSEAQAEFDALMVDYAQTTANDLMARGEAILEEAEAFVTC